LIESYFNLKTMHQYWDEHQRSQHNHAHLFWALLNIALWNRMLLTGRRPGSVDEPRPTRVDTAVAAS